MRTNKGFFKFPNSRTALIFWLRNWTAWSKNLMVNVPLSWLKLLCLCPPQLSYKFVLHWRQSANAAYFIQPSYKLHVHLMSKVTISYSNGNRPTLALSHQLQVLWSTSGWLYGQYTCRVVHLLQHHELTVILREQLASMRLDLKVHWERGAHCNHSVHTFEAYASWIVLNSHSLDTRQTMQSLVKMGRTCGIVVRSATCYQDNYSKNNRFKFRSKAKQMLCVWVALCTVQKVRIREESPMRHEWI